jgi:diguanylate cyclase (GGDEF)-like protein/PAS domain S-box-containing protein
MQSKSKHHLEYAISWTLLALTVALSWCSLTGHPPVVEHKKAMWLHWVLGLLAIVVSMQIFVAGYRALESPRKGAMVMLGLLFLGVGTLDFLHIMSNVDVTDEPSLASTGLLWLAARALAASALLVYVALPDSPVISWLQKRLGLGAVLLAVCLIWGADLLWRDHVFALSKVGLDLPFIKAGLPWLIVGIHLINFGVLWRRRADLGRERFTDMCFTVCLLSISDLLVIELSIKGDEGLHLMGHVYMVASYLYLFQSTLNESLRLPLAGLAKQNQRENLTLSIAPNGILWINKNGTILEANPAAAVLTGYPQSDMVGQSINLFFPSHLRGQHAEQLQGYFTKPKPDAVMDILDAKLLCRDGSLLPVDISVGLCEDAGEQHAIVYISNLTERKKFEATLRDQAFHDELTGLPNRRLFYQLLQQTLARADRSGERVVVLLLDLDGFKTINDSFGHATGDALLAQAGKRMRAVLRESDTLARLGGDEFAILLDGIGGISDATQVASKLLLTLSAVYQVQGLEVSMNGSLGLAFFPDDGNDGDTMLRYADMAMYAAKAAGRSTYCLYSQDMEQSIHEDMQIHMRLKDAIGMGTLALHYQPQVEVVSGAIVGVEALLRWADPVLGPVSPARFIRVAESSGLILTLSDWVLETACTQIADWMQAGTPVRVAVNFSAQQFRQHDLPERVADTLRRTGAQAQWLDIEITETIAMTHPEKAAVQLNALVALGCRVSLDDFGTGYSSLSYLKSLPIHKLKIDKSFMDGVPHEANDSAISRSIIALAHSLGMELTAEGVETDAQLAFLRLHGCETYQGWLFAKAMTAAELTMMLPAKAAHNLTTAEGVDQNV